MLIEIQPSHVIVLQRIYNLSRNDGVKKLCFNLHFDVRLERYNDFSLKSRIFNATNLIWIHRADIL